MEIMKVFSSYDDYGYEDERLYSVLLSEVEIREFSEYLEQKEYVSKRAAKKLAKKTARIEQELQDAIRSSAGDPTRLNQAQEEYMSKMGKEVLNKKNAGKIIDASGKAPIIKPIKNDRAAEQIAGALGNGNAKVKAEIARDLKKSSGGRGLNVSEYVTSRESQAVNSRPRTRPRTMKGVPVPSRAIEHIDNRGGGSNYQYNNITKKSEGVLEKVTKKLSGMSTKGKVGLAAGAALATGGAAYGIHKATKKKKDD